MSQKVSKLNRQEHEQRISEAKLAEARQQEEQKQKDEEERLNNPNLYFELD